MRERAKCSSVSRFYGVVAGELAGYSYMMPIKQLRVSPLLFFVFLDTQLPFSYIKSTKKRNSYYANMLGVIERSK